MKLTSNLAPGDASQRFLSSEIRRVVFLANNADIAVSSIAELNPGGGDVVVQYNKPMFFDALAGYRCHKMQFLYPDHRHSCHGFTEDGKPDMDYAAQDYSTLTFAIANVVPKCLEPYFASLEHKAQHLAIVPDRHIALHTYPAGKLPSGGFISVGYFRTLNWVRKKRALPALELVTVGFTGSYRPGTGWVGHDFGFEQLVYRTWLDLRRLAADGTVIDPY
jgi:hypothetical protein